MKLEMISEESGRLHKRELTPVEFRQYYIDRTLFEMIKVARGREIALLGQKGAIRHIKAHALYFLKENFKAFNFFDGTRNIYYSLAHLENMPMFSFVPSIRVIQQESFNQNFLQYFKGIDLGMDFDEGCKYCRDKNYCTKHKKMISLKICSICSGYETNFDDVYGDTKRIKFLFDEWCLPYQLKFSGSGFHINIEWKYIKDSLDVIQRVSQLQNGRLQSSAEVETVTLSKWFISELAEILNCPTLDTSVTDIRRIWKMPYSIDIKTGNVALPLTDSQFANFNFDMVKPENVIDNIRDRGLLERQGTSEGFKNFLESFLMG
jgi:hypothetical protein